MAKKTKRQVTVHMKMNNETYTATADTLLEALELLPKVTPKTKGMLTVLKDGKESKPMHLTIPMYNRLFFPGLTGEIQRVSILKRYALNG